MQMSLFRAAPVAGFVRMSFAGALLIAAALAVASAGDDVVARRGTAALTLDEVDARLEEVPADIRAGFMNSPDRIEQVVSQLLLVEQIANEAVADGLDKDPSFVPQLELARKRILAKMKLDRERASATTKVDAAALANERYIADTEKYFSAESRSARHILLEATDSNEKVRLAAEQVRTRLRAGADFASLARELSDDLGTRNEGGMIADITPGRTDPAFETALFALEKPGQISAVVKSRFGYHVIELVSVRPRAKIPFESVRDAIEAEVRSTESDRAGRSYSDQLQSMALDADPDLVMSLRSRYGTVSEMPRAASAN